MDGEAEQYPKPHLETGEDLSAVAALRFKALSGRYMASTIAQSLALAIWCQEEGYDPKKLGMALLEDSQQLVDVSDAATNAHKIGEARKTPTDKIKRWAAGRAKAPKRVSADRVREIVEDVFTKMTPELISYDKEDLAKLLAWYPDKIKPGMPAHIIEEDYDRVKRELQELDKARKTRENRPDS